jgi:hypothetical protein
MIYFILQYQPVNFEEYQRKYQLNLLHQFQNPIFVMKCSNISIGLVNLKK